MKIKVVIIDAGATGMGVASKLLRNEKNSDKIWYRCLVNISGGLQATVIAARNQDLIENDKFLLKNYPFKGLHKLIRKVGTKLLVRSEKIEKIQTLKKDTKVKINALKKVKNSENDIKFLKEQLKKDIKAIKNGNNI